MVATCHKLGGKPAVEQPRFTVDGTHSRLCWGGQLANPVIVSGSYTGLWCEAECVLRPDHAAESLHVMTDQVIREPIETRTITLRPALCSRKGSEETYTHVGATGPAFLELNQS